MVSGALKKEVLFYYSAVLVFLALSPCFCGKRGPVGLFDVWTIVFVAGTGHRTLSHWQAWHFREV